MENRQVSVRTRLRKPEGKTLLVSANGNAAETRWKHFKRLANGNAAETPNILTILHLHLSRRNRSAET